MPVKINYVAVNFWGDWLDLVEKCVSNFLRLPDPVRTQSLCNDGLVVTLPAMAPSPQHKAEDTSKAGEEASYLFTHAIYYLIIINTKCILY